MSIQNILRRLLSDTNIQILHNSGTNYGDCTNPIIPRISLLRKNSPKLQCSESCSIKNLKLLTQSSTYILETRILFKDNFYNIRGSNINCNKTRRRENFRTVRHVIVLQERLLSQAGISLVKLPNLT